MTNPKNAMIGPTTAQKLELVMGLLLLIVPRALEHEDRPEHSHQRADDHHDEVAAAGGFGRSMYLPSAAVTFSRPLTNRSLVVASATEVR